MHSDTAQFFLRCTA